MNKQLQEEKHCPVSYGEFLHWIGLWFLMPTINGPEHQEFCLFVKLIGWQVQ